MNIMLLSIPVWSGNVSRHHPGAARFLPLAVGADRLAGGGLFGAAVLPVALARAAGGRTNMDVPISIGIVLALAMSVMETIHHAEHAYFDAALMLLAFLLAAAISIRACAARRARWPEISPR